MQELTILLDPESKRPLYEQIYAYIRGEIRSGSMGCGMKLPSARALAGHLQVSRSTVDLAYAKLQDEGYIAPVPCKGFFVCDIATLYELPLEKVSETVVKQERPDCRYDFSLNGIDENGFPFATWNRLARMALLDTEQHMFRQGQANGEQGLRESLREYLHYARGVECSASQIVIGAGNDYLLMLLSVILGKDKVIAMENPTYLKAYTCFRTLGYTVTAVDMDEEGISVDSLCDSGGDIAYVMPSHQFPTGTMMTMKRRTQLIRWTREKEGRYIIEDDYDSEFRYTGRPIPSLQGYDGGQHVIYLGTFSKSIAPSIRISYMVLPQPLLAAYRQRAACFSTTVSRVDQRVMEQFIRQGHFERHLNRMRGIYRKKHDRLVSAVRAQSLPVRIHGENAGLHIVLETAREQDVKVYRQKAEKAGIRVYCLSDYFLHIGSHAVKDCLLLGYATMAETEIEQAVEELFTAFCC